MSLKAKLIVVGGTVKNTEVALDLPAIIGRGRSAQITIPHSLVSRQHCKIEEVQGQLVVCDLGSLNGTYVGNELITDAVPLPPGALLTVGTVTFRAVYEAGGQDSSNALAERPFLAGHPDDSTVDEVSAVEDDTAKLAPGELPSVILPPRANQPAPATESDPSPSKPE